MKGTLKFLEKGNLHNRFSEHASRQPFCNGLLDQKEITICRDMGRNQKKTGSASE